MSQKGPPSSFLIFCNWMYVNKSQRAPFYIFRRCATFPKEIRIENFKFFSKNMFSAFWALDIAPTLDVPVLFSLRQTRSDEIFVQFVQLNEYLGNASKLAERVPLSVFRSPKNFSTTYQIVFFCFFFSRPFQENFKFLKTVHTIFIKLCTVILHPKGPLRAQRHQNRKTGMWET